MRPGRAGALWLLCAAALVCASLPRAPTALRGGRLVGAQFGEAVMTVIVTVEGADLPPFERRLPAETRVDITPGIALARPTASLAQDAGVTE